MAKENPALQGDYFSEPINGTYYTIYIVFADYDSGTIQGRWGKGAYLGHSLGVSGYRRADDGHTTDMTLNFIFEKCVLQATDYSYSRLSGELISTVTNQSLGTIVFNKSKTNWTNG
ncbi:hypothetical protein [Pseudomonas sp. 1152_12]|uniref:hypothetical protein n=1 Tax=Pseudomonas sp. 1152_12 TaxID=2604455 RepID=UPI004063CB57